MKIFIAGGTGAIGRYLVPMLVAAGHEVVALTRSAQGAAQLAQMGARPVRGDIYDEPALAAQVREAAPEVVVHQLTAFGTKSGNPFVETARLRIDGTRSLVAAARAAGARRFIAQSISFACAPRSGGLTDEETPLFLDSAEPLRTTVQAVDSLERQALQAEGMAGVVLRYGWFYGPGTVWDPSGTLARAVREGAYPIVGSGAGTYSFIHLGDAAAATLKALERPEARGIYNIVDDAPAPLAEWLPVMARLLGAPAPGFEDTDAARRRLGDVRVFYLTGQAGASNRKARRVLGWQPSLPSWRAGFEALYGPPGAR